MTENVRVYHTNDKSKCDKFIVKNGQEMIVSKDRVYLGKGMYFWDNLSNAHYWFKERKRKDYTVVLGIVSCGIYLSSILDLTDDNIRARVNEIWKDFEQKDDENMSQLGLRLDYILRFSPLMKKFKGIKAHVSYDNPIGAEGTIFSGSHIDATVRTIYCIKCNSTIKVPIQYETINLRGVVS